MKSIYNKFIDITGKVLLAWLVFSTIRYFYYGRFCEEIRMISRSFNSGFGWWSVYNIIQIPFAAIGIFIIIPLLLKGRILGLILGILHWAMGYPTNPLWFIVPRNMQIGPGGRATSILWVINTTYSIVTILILLAFFFYRRSMEKQHRVNN
jgi:hypothetical protein